MVKPRYDPPVLGRDLQGIGLTGLDWHLLKTVCCQGLSEDQIQGLLRRDREGVLKKLQWALQLHKNKLGKTRQSTRYAKRKEKGKERCWCGEPAVPGPDTPRCQKHAVDSLEDMVATYYDPLGSPWLRREDGSSPVRTLKKIRKAHACESPSYADFLAESSRPSAPSRKRAGRAPKILKRPVREALSKLQK